ncbi:MAG: DUF5069 domain-containing protein [Candidatus Eremiobacteraeota bacterium]|nr:DUF5069 domain-containing protein [Candidatus Eremiobacteraeota bacterium]
MAVVTAMATDFRDGKTFPRRGREAMGQVLWLARMTDKARAAAAGTIHDYIYPCPMDEGVMERWGITSSIFDAAIQQFANDEAIARWLQEHVPEERIRRANAWLVAEKRENLDRQDAEETQ